MIDRDHALSVTRQAEAVGIARSTVYYLPRPVPVADLELMRQIDRLHMEFPFAGSRMLRRLLAANGSKVGRRHVKTLMQRMGIEALYRRPRTTKPQPGHKIFPYLLRGVEITRPNQAWAMDITYIPMARGFVYLAVVLDWFSRRVLAWRVSITMEASFCVETLEEALAKHGKPDIFNTDQGSQFTCPAFTGVLATHAIRISMDGKGAWRDNVFVERLWRSVKYEEVYLRAYGNVRRHANRSGAISISTIAVARIRALTDRHPIKPTPATRACCRSAWQLNPGGRSTYRSGNSVRTSGATSDPLQPFRQQGRFARRMPALSGGARSRRIKSWGERLPGFACRAHRRLVQRARQMVSEFPMGGSGLPVLPSSSPTSQAILHERSPDGTRRCSKITSSIC